MLVDRWSPRLVLWIAGRGARRPGRRRSRPRHALNETACTSSEVASLIRGGVAVRCVRSRRFRTRARARSAALSGCGCGALPLRAASRTRRGTTTPDRADDKDQAMRRRAVPGDGLPKCQSGGAAQCKRCTPPGRPARCSGSANRSRRCQSGRRISVACRARPTGFPRCPPRHPPSAGRFSLPPRPGGRRCDVDRPRGVAGDSVEDVSPRPNHWPTSWPIMSTVTDRAPFSDPAASLTCAFTSASRSTSTDRWPTSRPASTSRSNASRSRSKPTAVPVSASPGASSVPPR